MWLHSSHFALIAKWVFPTHGLRNNFLCVTVHEFNNLKLYRRYVKNDKKIPHDGIDGSRGVIWDEIKTERGSTNHEKVKCTKLLQVLCIHLGAK